MVALWSDVPQRAVGLFFKRKMTYLQAMKILDKVREGAQYPQNIINQALRLTGDLDE